ncbi:MAG: glutathione S-transferase family protein [Candidatus Dadabacteria bacterium]|nr:glutathione S-transferase family protein [Candidatus Dadabacteria bacterium]NIQ13364.1 glutathione S-transferase family protein [Candidatus Dadabacteria bacterium]
MIKLYDHPLSGNAYKPRLLLFQLGVEFERVMVDLFEGENKTEEFTKLNPNQKIPVIVEKEFVMWESNAILLYLAKKFSPNKYISENAEIYGHTCQWVLFGKTTIDPNLAVARFILKFLPEDSHDPVLLKKLHTQGNDALKILDNHLKTNDFLTTDYSIADIACYPYIKLSYEGGFDISLYPNVQRWCESIEGTDGFVPFGD